MTDELYAQFDHSWLSIIVGKKQKPDIYNGLSAVNENILWSLNAQALPGIQINTKRPIYFSENKILGFEATWNEYLMGRQESVRNARVHHKSLRLLFNATKGWNFKVGIQHVAQWGGVSKFHGEQSTKFKDYLRVISGRSGGEGALEDEKANVLGNHIGSYELFINKKISNYNLGFIYNSIFEDGSGSRLANFPDGRYGLKLGRDNKKYWWNTILYEFYYSKNQSQTIPHLFDNYFNNYIYSTGWTYQKRVIGVPFFTIDYPEGGQLSKLSIWNNAVIVHHLGVSGFAFKKRPYKVLLSLRNNYGQFRNIGKTDSEHVPSDDPSGKYKLPKNILSTYFDLNILSSIIDINVLFGGDFSSKNKILGGGIHLKKCL